MSSTSAPPQGRVDARPRARRLAAPLAAALGVVAATAFVAAVDPNQPGHYPMCPTLALLGVDCPGCGGLRATHALAHGDIGAAFDHNALFVLLVPVLIGLWAMWTYRAWTGVSPPASPRREAIMRSAPIVVLIVAMAFAVVRNLVPYLGSGVG